MNNLKNLLLKHYDIAIIFLFLFLTFLFAFPLFTGFNTTLTDHGDPYFVAWVMDTVSNNLLSLQNLHNGNIFYPYENVIAMSDHSLTLAIQILPLKLITDNHVAFINYTQILGFFLTGLFSYYLIKFYTKHTIASIIGACIITFNPYHIGQISHLQIFSMQYLPLMILMFEKLLKEQTFKASILFSLAFLANAFVSIYLFSFGLIALGIIFLIRICVNFEPYYNKKFVLNLLFSIVFSSIFLILLYYPYLGISELFNKTYSAEEVLHFSATPKDYIAIPSNSLLLRNLSFRDTNDAEKTLYIGILVPIISVLGLIYFMLRHKKSGKYHTNIIYISIVLLCLLISFGNELSFKGSTTKLPFHFLHEYIPFFTALRVPPRVSVITIIAVGILFSIFLKTIIKSKLRNNRKKIIYILLSTIVLLEMLMLPISKTKSQHTDNEKTIYYWMKENIPSEEKAIHYPFFGDTFYMQFLKYDDRKIFNGYSGFVPESTQRLMESGNNKSFIKNPETLLSIIATLDINYFILHSQQTRGNITHQDNLNLSKWLLNNPQINLLISSPSKHILVFDISKLRKEEYIDNDKLDITGTISNNKLDISFRNTTDKPWVVDKLRVIEIVTELQNKENNKLMNKKVYMPLFLLENEEVKYSLDLETSFKYDSYEVSFSYK